jgi:hypothetical protein
MSLSDIKPFIPRGMTLTRSEQEELRRAAQARGDNTVAAEAGLSRNGLLRALGGMSVHHGTATLCRIWIEKQRGRR